jgi:hypothetical protein
MFSGLFSCACYHEQGLFDKMTPNKNVGALNYVEEF